MSITEFEHTLNNWGKQKIPFLCMVDFEMKNPVAVRLSDVQVKQMLFDINGISNAPPRSQLKSLGRLEKHPLPYEAYSEKFNVVSRYLSYGDSYLTNLTVKMEIKITATLPELFYLSSAKYKLLVHDQFLVFSPETFVKMRDGFVYSYPMKGTIDASIPDAHNLILNDVKELAEHVTIVDLIRNDLSQIADDVNVTRFRYIDTIKTDHNELLQVSSEIRGRLPGEYESALGSMLIKLLPAGSVSGAPKAKTVEIIRQAEGEDRGYYTGVFGIFDGHNFDSGVMIRFIEQVGDRLFYRSGGGITTQSSCISEYKEAIDKVYVPVIGIHKIS